VILFINLVHSFVLLTANISDVKKLAKQFVSESLAEQIADFISKLSHEPVNVSEENEMNAELPDASDDKSNKYVQRKRPDGMEPKSKNLKKVGPSQKRFEAFNDKPSVFSNSDVYKLSKMAEDLVKNIKSDFYTSRNYPDKQIGRTPATEPSYNADTDIIKDEKVNQNILFKQKNKLILRKEQSTIGYAENFGLDKFKFSTRPRFALMGVDDNYNETTRSSSKSKSKIGRQGLELTTRTAKTEFDQYDNTKYPKSELVATSGDLALPKVQWDAFESDIPKSEEKHDQEMKKQKLWF
jgi:hypothetical protein